MAGTISGEGAEAVGPGNITALVVDDNEINLIVAQEVLASVSADADLAGGGFRAVEMCRLRRYDIILMDHLMPDMDGIEAAKRILAFSDTPIVAMTANEDPEAHLLFMKNGFSGFLRKPIEAEELKTLLARLVPQKKLSALKKDGTDHPTLTRLAAELGLDTDRSVDKLGGNKGAYLRILHTFVQTCPQKLKALASMLEGQQWEAFRIAIHGQKGALANIGATELSEKARAIEAAVKDCKYAPVPAAFRIFRSRSEDLCESLNALWSDSAVPVKQATNADNERLPAALEKICQCLRHLEQDEALDILEPFFAIRFDEPLASDLTALRQAIDSFDYDNAMILIDGLQKGCRDQ